MKTLRAKLFVSIGAILLLAGILNTLAAEVWIKKDLNKAGGHINHRLEEVQDHIRKFVSFLLTFHIMEEATDLDRVIQIAATDSMPFQDASSLWLKAGSVLTYNHQLSFVQIQNSAGDIAIINPEEAHLYPFSSATASDGTLWVKVEGEIFKATAYEGYYLLSNAKLHEEVPSSLDFVTTSLPTYSYNWEDSSAHLFEAFLIHKEQWLEKMEFIRLLLPWQEGQKEGPPLGILKKGTSCLLTKDLFSQTLLIPYKEAQEKDVIPALSLRKTLHGEELDMVKSVSFKDDKGTILTLGVSLSSLLGEASLLLGKTIVVTGKDFVVGSTPNGKTFALSKNPFLENQGTMTWQGHDYLISTIDLTVLKIFVLTPLEEATATTRFLHSLSAMTTQKISFTLMGAALFSFLIALFLLSNISKKITEPIAVLSKAAKTLGTGSYSDVVLPEIHHRKDEVATLARSFEGMVSALKDRDKIHGLLNKVVSKEISQKILEQNIELSGEEKVVTLLFSDIRGFTDLAEHLSPHVLIEFLNAYMTRMCRIIDETRGVVDKFIGDAIMTLYGAPVPLEFHAVKAIEAALLMMEDLEVWNQERKNKNLRIFEIGIGIHTGLVYTGNMGAENRLNYTAIGSNVNQASRLCSVAKPMQILISEETLNSQGVEEKFDVRKLEPLQLKGIHNPVQVYEVLSQKL
jgi:class 3 adenylate cyclase